MASTYLSKTFGTATNRKKFTVSFWMKRTGLSSTQIIFAGTNGSSDEFIYLSGSDGINAECASGQLVSNAVLRDTSAWYHVVYKFDSSQATAGDRTALYINGTEISYSTETQPAQDATPSYINNSNLHTIGKRGSSNDSYFDGLITHFHFCDGYAYDASDFGSTDSTTGEWKIKTSPSVTYGTNGFFILKDGNSVTDQSGNSNNWTVANGTLSNTEDCPSNIFATLNPLWLPNSVNTFSNGNTTHTVSGSFRSACTTLGATSGKFYAEYKATDIENFVVGIVPLHTDLLNSAQNQIGDGGNGWGISYNWGTVSYRNGGSNTTVSHTFSNGDIIMIAMDLDNDKVFFGKNGTWFDSGDPANGTNPAFSNVSDVDAIGFGSSPENANGSWNFGNGYFGTTAISSEGTNASGIGKFEYDVPTGYTALCTKGLNE